MFIELKQTIECSNCGPRSYETFQTTTESGTRCLKCGHEQRALHKHLQAESSGTVSWSKSSDDVIKF